MEVTHMIPLRWLLAVPVVLGVSCGPQQPTDGPVRSPRNDYPHPPAQTSDGMVVGADNQGPDVLLEERGGSSKAAPGWTIDEHGVSYDPKRPAGRSDQAAIPERKPGSIPPDAGAAIPGAKAPP
jgi:hypothetical protein